MMSPSPQQSSRKEFSALPNHGFQQVVARLPYKAVLKMALTIGFVIWCLGFRFVTKNALRAEQAVADTLHLHIDVLNRQRNVKGKPAFNSTDDVPILKYTIPGELVPKVQVRMVEHDYKKEIIINEDGQESFISDEAFKEFGNEIRYLVHDGKGQLYGYVDQNGKLDATTLTFRKRFHHRAPWLRGDYRNSLWPLNTLPAPVVGRAVFVCAGNPQLPYLRNLIHSIRIVHKSQMPIRVVYRDDDDLSERSRKNLIEFLPKEIPANIQFVDLSKIFDLEAAGLKAGWNLKPYGFLAVPETELISLDVDIILLQPPEKLFESQGYRDTGALFFHDRFFMNLMGMYDPSHLARALQPHLSLTAEAAFRYGNTRYIGEHIQESGVVVIDKQRRLQGIWSICLLMGREDVRNYAQGYYAYGDKELYWIGFETAAEPYTFSRYYPGVYGGVATNFDNIDIAIKPKDKDVDTKERLKEANEKGLALCGRVVHFDDQNLPLWSNGGYFTKEEDWQSTSDLAEFPLNAVWYVDGGDWLHEEFLPNVPDFGGVRNTMADVILAQAHADWEAAKAQKGRMNQHWQTHGGMGVMCLNQNARGIREVPTEIANVATNAAKRFFLVEKKMTEKYGDLW